MLAATDYKGYDYHGDNEDELVPLVLCVVVQEGGCCLHYVAEYLFEDFVHMLDIRLDNLLLLWGLVIISK